MEIQTTRGDLLCRVFPLTLKGISFHWFMNLPSASITNFSDLARKFVTQHIALVGMKDNPTSPQRKRRSGSRREEPNDKIELQRPSTSSVKGNQMRTPSESASSSKTSHFHENTASPREERTNSPTTVAGKGTFSMCQKKDPIIQNYNKSPIRQNSKCHRWRKHTKEILIREFT